MRGELHGAYYHFVRIGGKLHKRYLKPGEVELTNAGCAARQRNEKQLFWDFSYETLCLINGRF